VRLEGIAGAIQELVNLPKIHGEVMEKTLLDCGKLILDRSKVYVPVATGSLRDTGDMSEQGTGWDMEVFVFYGGPDAHYAVYVHENTHAYHMPPTSAKFLELAVNETHDARQQILENNYRAAAE